MTERGRRDERSIRPLVPGQDERFTHPPWKERAKGVTVFGKSLHFSLGKLCDPRSQFNFYALVREFISFVSQEQNKQPKTFWSVQTSDAHGARKKEGRKKKKKSNCIHWPQWHNSSIVSCNFGSLLYSSGMKKGEH